ncbi:MAG: LysR family transcriptional regulator [Pseudomonadota bacterium]
MSKLPFAGLEIFLAIARHGSIRAAAGSLGLRPSTVSHRLRGLEDRLGVSLFARTTRSVSLTDSGRALLRTAGPAMDQIETAIAQSQKAGSVRKGVLRLNMPYIAYQVVLAERLEEFRAAYPDIDLELSLSDSLADVVAEGLHAGIRFGDRVQEDMIAVPVSGPSVAQVFGAPSYLDARGKPETPQDLLHHNCLRYRFIGSRLTAAWDFAGADGPFTVDVKGDLITNSQSVIVDRTARGHGLSHLVCRFTESLVDEGAIAPLLGDYAYAYPALFLYFPRENRRNEVLRAFVEFFRG